MLWRLAPRRWQRRLALLPVLAVAAGLATAGIEAGWYALATGARADGGCWRPTSTSPSARGRRRWIVICGTAAVRRRGAAGDMGGAGGARRQADGCGQPDDLPARAGFEAAPG